MYGLGKVGGQLAVSVGFGAVTWAGFWFILRRTTLRPTQLVRHRRVPGSGAVAGVAVWGPRPQMITFALVCVELYLIERYLRHRLPRPLRDAAGHARVGELPRRLRHRLPVPRHRRA